MTQPLNVAEDWKVSRADDLEAVTVESLDPQAADGSDVLATATGVTALAGRETVSEDAIASGPAVAQKRDFTLVAGEIAFAVKPRDRITRADGSKFKVGLKVETGGFGALVICRECEQERA